MRINNTRDAPVGIKQLVALITTSYFKPYFHFISVLLFNISSCIFESNLVTELLEALALIAVGSTVQPTEVPAVIMR